VTATRTTTIRTIHTPSAVSGGGIPSPIPSAELTIEAVFDAYFDCRRHKRNSINQLRFEADLETNLVRLYRDLRAGDYKIGRSIAFVVRYPKVREVWAADFRDRVVHHVVYNAVRERFYNRFIRDAYACIPERGIHDGLRRVSGFARSITRNGTRHAYAMKADIANFFNSIDQERLIAILERRVSEDWLRILIRQIVLHNPRPGAFLKSSPDLFALVPRHKSFMHAPEGKGLPIGNLTSQFFANVYMNELDQFVKHGLRVRYYGRYVDDMILFHEDARVLNGWYDAMAEFLEERLCMRMHSRKKWINRVEAGIDFTGFVIKPGRTYLRETSLSRCRQKIRAWERKGSPVDADTLESFSASLNSYLGLLRQVNGYRARKALCRRVENLWLVADEECRKVLPPREFSQ